jgi:hypothetical protein
MVGHERHWWSHPSLAFDECRSRRPNGNGPKVSTSSSAKRLVDIITITAGVTAHFEDSTSETGSVIIDGDGGASQVRKWLLGPLVAPYVLPYVFMNFSFCSTSEHALYVDKHIHPIVAVGAHPDSMYLALQVLDKPDLQKPEPGSFTYWQLGH